MKSRKTFMNRRQLLQGTLASLVAGKSLSASVLIESGHHGDAPEPDSKLVATDRWLEIDLYWFQLQDPLASAKAFWDRYLPFYMGVEGYRGLIVNVGWTVACVMDWAGDLDQRIDLPKGTGQQKWVDQNGPLTGTTEQRRRQWKQRFAQPTLIKSRGYDAWTYGSLKKLVSALGEEGARRGITEFKVGLMNYAWTNAYGEVPAWIRRHPEAFSPLKANPNGWSPGPYFDPAANLHADPHPAAAWPQGMPEGTSVHLAYAQQWGSLSQAIGLDALMLRNSFGMPMPYEHWGVLGRLAPSAEAIRSATRAVAALVRETKTANPHALVMMYSNAATAIGDWRCNCFDLETIAKEGYLDIWVDQTWAGDWNEVGVREETFWNAPLNGYTYQLTYMLMHAAILADTKVRHYPLVECPDAWEAEDVLHTVPERLRWEIWAYSHAAVKTLAGLKFPVGTYVAMVNRGDQLMSEKDVQFPAGNINDAVRDASRTTEIFGPTLVYSRAAMQWQADHARPDHDIKEWIDEAAGGVIKWPIPLLTATRLEWVPKVKSDLFIFQTPSHLPPQQAATIAEWIKQGNPAAIWGSPAGGVDPELEMLGGLIAGEGGDAYATVHPATLGSGSPAVAENVPGNFATYHRLTSNRVSNEARVVYSVEGSPVLILNNSAGKRLMMWDPPDVSGRGDPDGRGTGSLRDIWGGSAGAYALAAGAVNSLLSSRPDALRAAHIDLNQTMSVIAWRTRDGALHLLAGNLEEGLRDDSDATRHATMVLPEPWKAARWKDAWSPTRFKARHRELEIELGQAKSILLVAG
jgi:hypothetical protein